MSLRTNRVIHSSGSLGAAYFDPIKYVVRVVEDTLETSHFDSMTMRASAGKFPGRPMHLPAPVLELVGPDQILTTRKTDDGCIRLLQKHGAALSTPGSSGLM